MPRRKMSRAISCEAHGTACALAGGSRYSSEFCQPATTATPQELELRQFLAEAPHGTATVTESKPPRPAVRDARFREILARAEADEAIREAAILGGAK